MICDLEDVEDLFFDLFEKVFHFDDEDLHLGLVGLGAECVDFAAHFLGDEAELFADAVGLCIV